VPVSVVGVGTEVKLDEIDRLVLSGQGNRRLLTVSDEARGVVDRELSALSRAVARALRLRIRLAPGVRLIDVLDAHRLDREGEERTRAAEQSIDLRMARDLGIEADRGEDEEGIQIVIPSFYAGDSHTILLDVVAKGPGPIAEVTLRYKDLIYQKNGVARAQLKLAAESASMGPLEDNVRKNVLAVRLSNRLERVADTLRSRDDVDARQQLEAEHAWIVSARSRIPAFQNDVELAADLTMLEEYLALIQEKPLSHPGVREELALSLQLAGIYKRLPRPRAD
jgi:hypothetical protein